MPRPTRTNKRQARSPKIAGYRQAILAALTDANGDFVSGEAIATSLGISRAAVWKHILALKGSGYDIGSITNKGYRLTGAADTLDPDLAGMAALAPEGFTIVHFESIDSTNRKALELAKAGVTAGTVVVSEEQVAGRGRMQRAWVAPKGGIWFSPILRPSIPPHKAPLITLIAGVAVAQAIRDVCTLDARIKWPNDVLIGGKKVCGILTEMDAEMDHVNCVVVGIGINANNNLDALPPEVRSKVTSLKEELGGPVPRPRLLKAVLQGFSGYATVLNTEKDRQRFLKQWRSLSDTLGRRVRVETVGETVEGEAVDIDAEGALLVKVKGKVQRVLSGDCVHLR